MVYRSRKLKSFKMDMSTATAPGAKPVILPALPKANCAGAAKAAVLNHCAIASPRERSPEIVVAAPHRPLVQRRSSGGNPTMAETGGSLTPLFAAPQPPEDA